MIRPVSLGIDLGTSALKAVLLDPQGALIGQAERRLSISRPQPGWSEQDPGEWWGAARAAMAMLRAEHPADWSSIACIGLTGQMHGAVTIDRHGLPIRPAILHNDGRAAAECHAIEAAVPRVAQIAGSRPMAGLTAPKLLWMARHEPNKFAAIDCVLSPKDYLRMRLTGECLTDESDAAGTLWFDVTRREWHEPLVKACGLVLDQLPDVLASDRPSGRVRPDVAEALGLPAGVVVAAGGGDTPVSGLGIGAIAPGDAFINLSTSASLFVVAEQPVLDAQASIHAWCHAVPQRSYQMGAMLSGASCLRWISGIAGAANEDAMLRLIELRMAEGSSYPARQVPLFLPYLSGERTPHNDVDARGVFFGMSHDSDAALLGHAVLEGVCFGLRDAMAAIESTGTRIGSLAVVGGGARSAYWLRLLANVLGKPVHRPEGADLGAALGAARLGRIALGEDELPTVCAPAAVISRQLPSDTPSPLIDSRYRHFRDLYGALSPLFGQWAQTASSSSSHPLEFSL